MTRPADQVRIVPISEGRVGSDDVRNLKDLVQGPRSGQDITGRSAHPDPTRPPIIG